MKANQLTCRPKWDWHGLANLITWKLTIAKGSGGRCATGDNRPVQGFAAPKFLPLAVICVQFDERDGKCSIRNLKPKQDISDA